MTGRYEHSVDAKGRVFVPAKLREELGPSFHVTISSEPCLCLYPDAAWTRITEKYESLPYSKAKPMRPLFVNAADCEPDAQGRIVLPPELRRNAGLKKDVVIVGVSGHAEIWDAEEWAAVEEKELNPESLSAAMEELGF